MEKGKGEWIPGVWDKTMSHKGKGQPLPLRPAFYTVVFGERAKVPPEFLVVLFESVFHLKEDGAIDTALRDDPEMKFGLYTRDVAETKLRYITDMVKANGFEKNLAVWLNREGVRV